MLAAFAFKLNGRALLQAPDLNATNPLYEPLVYSFDYAGGADYSYSYSESNFTCNPGMVRRPLYTANSLHTWNINAIESFHKMYKVCFSFSPLDCSP